MWMPRVSLRDFRGDRTRVAGGGRVRLLNNNSWILVDEESLYVERGELAWTLSDDGFIQFAVFPSDVDGVAASGF